MTGITHSASAKAAILTAIALLLLIPLALLQSLVTERTRQRDSAVQSVARGWGDRQWIGGPVLAIPVTNASDPTRASDWYVLPDKLDITVALEVQNSRRRLHEVFAASHRQLPTFSDSSPPPVFPSRSWRRHRVSQPISP